MRWLWTSGLSSYVLFSFSRFCVHFKGQGITTRLGGFVEGVGASPLMRIIESGLSGLMARSGKSEKYP